MTTRTKPAAAPVKKDLMGLWDNVEGESVERSNDFWKPRETGDILTGLYAGKRDGSQYGPIADIKTQGGTIIPVGLNAVLLQTLTGDLVGRYVAIQYTGDKETARGANPMRDFRVKVLDKEESEELQAMLDELPF